MAIAYNPCTVTNGLVLALDAGNIKSYDGTENLLTYSEQFDNTAWLKYQSGITTNTTATLAPDGTYTAEKLVEDTSNNQHYTLQIRTGSNETTTFSVFCKAAERTKVFLQLTNTVSYTAQATYDLIAGTAGTPNASNADYSNISTNIIPYPNGWYRCILTATKGSVNTSNTPAISTVNVSAIYAGDGTSGIYIWGAQLEKGSVANPYYPTTATAKIRGTTWNDLSGNGNTGTLLNTPTYNSNNGGTLVFDGFDDTVIVPSSASLGNDKVNTSPIISLDFWANVTRKSGGGLQYQQLAGFRNGSIFGFFVLLFDTSGDIVNTEARFWNSAGQAFDIAVNYTPYFNKWTHISFVANVSRTDLYINANLVGSRTDITGSFGASSGNFAIGATPSGGFQTLGNISSVKVYNRALTASEVQQNFNALRGRYNI